MVIVKDQYILQHSAYKRNCVKVLTQLVIEVARKNNTRKNTVVSRLICVLSNASKKASVFVSVWVRTYLFTKKLLYFRGSCVSQCFILSKTSNLLCSIIVNEMSPGSQSNCTVPCKFYANIIWVTANSVQCL